MDHQQKTSIRFYNDREVRAVWDEETSKSKKGNAQLVRVTIQLKLQAPDGKRYNTNVMGMDSVRKLALSFPNTKAMMFIDWLTSSDNSIDGQNRTNPMKHTYSTPSTSSRSLPGFCDPLVILRRSFGEGSLANHSANQ